MHMGGVGAILLGGEGGEDKVESMQEGQMHF